MRVHLAMRKATTGTTYQVLSWPTRLLVDMHTE